MIIIEKEKCTGCGACVRDCLNRALVLEDGKVRWVRDCFRCMHCIAVCPENAVFTDDPEYAMEEVVSVDEASCCIPPEKMLKAIRSRRTIRHFQKRPVEREKLEMLLDAGRYSPTGSNAQNVSYIVIQKDMERFNALAMRQFRSYDDPKRFSEVFPPPFSRDRIDFSDDDFLFKGADTVILTICPRDDNASIASANMELTANGLGLGMLYVGFFVRLANADLPLREYLGLSGDDHVATVLGFGYPDVKYYRTVPRKAAKVRWM